MRRFTTASLALTIAATSVFAGAIAVYAQEDPEWKVAMLADVGSLDDKNFNEYTLVGTNAAAEALGLPEPAAVVPKDDSEYGSLLQALIDDAQKDVTGEARIKLYKGSATVAGRRSPLSLYDPAFATFEEDAVYDQQDATGFIRLNALRLRIRALRDQAQG